MEQNYILIAKKEDIYIPSFIIDNYSKRILKRISLEKKGLRSPVCRVEPAVKIPLNEVSTYDRTDCVISAWHSTYNG